MDLIKQFKSARRVATPLLAIRTADPAATVLAIRDSLNGGGESIPLLQWDIIRGMVGLNNAGKEEVRRLCKDGDPAALTGNPAECLSLATGLRESSILFFLNAHRYVASEAVAQAIWNLRDLFKSDRRTLVLLCPSAQFPAEIAQDVISFDEPLPTAAQLQEIIKAQYKNASLDEPTAAVLEKATDAVSGLAAFPAEQVTAMSLTRDGLDIEALWERKRQVIEQTPGLSVWRGGEKFSDIGGVENIKGFLTQVLQGQAQPRAIVFIDEIEKALAGSSGAVGDSSGVSQSMLGTLLTYMQDKSATGMIFIGPPGSAKSMVAKATGAEAAIPTISFDLAGMKASLVGESEARLREALKVVSAVSGDRALFIATCNSIGILPPELRRRFTFGTFFFDLPTREERQKIWSIYRGKYDLVNPTDNPIPDDTDWTGAEIKQCCELAWRLRCTLKQAATFIVPVARSASDAIEKLRSQASGRFVSASAPGVYRHESKESIPQVAKVQGQRAPFTNPN